MSTHSSTRPDLVLARESGAKQLATFREDPPPVSSKLIKDAEMEGQMRGLPNVFFQLGHTRAETSVVGTCVAVGYISANGPTMRIYRKTERGWSAHTYTLEVSEPRKSPRSRLARPAGPISSPSYAWQPNAVPSAVEARKKRRRQQRARLR